MTYKEALKRSLFSGWLDFVVNDSVCGNGFVILAYGLKLVAFYAIFFAIRVLMLVVFPLTALILIKIDRDKKARYEQWLKKASEDL
jgi:hypothetical protein